MAGVAQADVPSVTRIAVVRNSTDSAGIGQFGAIQTAAASLGVQMSPIDVRDPGEIERAIAALARSPNIGLVVTGSASITGYRNLIIALAARYKIPAVHANRLGSRRRADIIRAGRARPVPARRRLCRSRLQRRKAGGASGAGADQIRNGDQSEVATALGLTVPEKLLAAADEVIE
jgi:putative ABC transport system substrate-binding protein